MATAVCFVMATLAWGTVFYGHSVYMDALMAAHGWSTTLVSSAIFVFWMAALPGTLLVGHLVDRVGAPAAFAAGGLLVGGGLTALGLVARPWQLFAVYAVLGFGYPALAATAIGPTLVQRFDRNFGLALAIALSGASLGGAVIPVLLVQGSTAYGFEAVMTTAGLAVLSIVLSLVVVLYFVPPPGPTVTRVGAPAAFSLAATLSRPLFWWLAFAAALGLGGQIGFLAHQIPIMAVHLDAVTAALMVTVVAVASALGRLLVGWLTRHLSVYLLAAAIYAVHGAGIAIVALSGTAVWLLVGCAVAGLAVGAIVMMPPILVRATFGTDGFGRTYAVVNVVMYIMGGLAAWSVGLLKDLTSGYTAGLWQLFTMELLAAAMLLNRGWPGRMGKRAGIDTRDEHDRTGRSI